jgi:hypothetical protein
VDRYRELVVVVVFVVVAAAGMSRILDVYVEGNLSSILACSGGEGGNLGVGDTLTITIQ